MQHGEAQPALDEFGFRQLHQCRGQPSAPVGGFDVQVERITALVLGRMGRVGRPVDAHQANGRHRLLAVQQGKAVVATIGQTLAQPGAEVFAHHLQGRGFASRFEEHRLAVPADQFEVVGRQSAHGQA